MPDNQTGSPRTNRPLRPALRAGGHLSVHGETGHARFAGAPQPHLPRRIETLPVLRAAEQVLARQERSVAKRAVRIPADAFVSIASRALPAPAPVMQIAGPGAARGGGDPGSAREAPRSLARSIFFIVVLLATIALAYWTGRMRGSENVIVVPGPSSDRSAVV